MEPFLAIKLLMALVFMVCFALMLRSPKHKSDPAGVIANGKARSNEDDRDGGD